MPLDSHYETIIAGGGLRGSLIALALARGRPEVRILLIDRAARFGGDAIHAFAAADIPFGLRWMIEGIIVRNWTAYYVAFPEESRKMEGRIALAAPEQIHAEVVEGLQPHQWQLNTIVARCTRNEVILADGRPVRADLVLDFTTSVRPADGTGIEMLSHSVRFDKAHDLEFPILVDASMSGSSETSFLQYFPLGADLLEVRRLRYGALDSGSDFELPSLDNEGGQIVRSSKSLFRLKEDDMPAGSGDRAQSESSLRSAACTCVLPSQLPDAVRLAGSLLEVRDAGPSPLRDTVTNFGFGLPSKDNLPIQLARANRPDALQLLKSAFVGSER